MELFDQLPGLDIQIPQINPLLQGMWGGADDDSPSDFRASQLNLVIHFGETVSGQEGIKIFDTAIEFAQRYPCRIIILCPRTAASTNSAMQAKLYSLCYVGEKQAMAMCNCEAIILSYNQQDVSYLEDLISLWIENDLPVYHWFHQVDAKKITQKLLPLLHGCRRVIYDSAIENIGTLSQIPWPHPQAVSDLTQSILLPARQSIGQFLASYTPVDLVHQLKKVTIHYEAGHEAQAESLMHWQKNALAACSAGNKNELLATFRCEMIEQDAPFTLKIHWEYESDDQFTWTFNEKRRNACIHSKLNGTELTINQQVELSPLGVALAEAMFFAS